MNLSITNDCNRRCSYCFQKSWYLCNDEREKKEMSLETIERIIDMMPEHMPHIKFLGGEPTLYSNMDELLNLVRLKKKECTMISNISCYTSILKNILDKHGDVVKSWLINSDYPQSQEERFITNFKMLCEKTSNFSLSTTLFPDKEKIMESADRLIKLIKLIPENIEVNIRISPMAPNHLNNGFYDYSLDIVEFFQKIWDERMCVFLFDCPLNGCEIHPEMMKTFDKFGKFVDYKNHFCRGSGPFDILVDNSVIYCSSTYNTIRLDNIFDYSNIEEAQRAMFNKWKEYWDSNELKCDYKNCGKYSPSRCMGVCAAKNELFV